MTGGAVIYMILQYLSGCPGRVGWGCADNGATFFCRNKQNMMQTNLNHCDGLQQP